MLGLRGAKTLSPRYIKVTDRQTGGWTDDCTSHGKSWVQFITLYAMLCYATTSASVGVLY